MKRLDELGVSPAPWTAESGPFVDMVYENTPTEHCAIVCGLPGERRKEDARLIAAAPDLYEALRDVVDNKCGECAYLRKGVCTRAKSKTPKCLFKQSRKALEKAGGKE